MNQKRNMRMISILLVFAMLFSLVPTTAFAADTTTIDTINITGIKAPVAGQTPETSGITENTEGFSIFATKWMKQSDNTDMDGIPFVEGETYYLMVDYTLDDGYEIGSVLDIISDPEASRAECKADFRYINLYYIASPAAATYTVSFKPNNADGTMDPVKVAPGEYTLPECRFTRTGYEFSGWAVGQNSSTQLKQPGEKINIADNITLYAKWQAKSYTITAVSEDESKGTVTGTGTYEYSEQALLKATPKKGYVFEGWYKEDGQRVIGSLANNSFFVSGNATYTAKFNELVTTANAVIDAPVEYGTPDMTPVASDSDKYTVTLYKWYRIDGSYNEISAEDTFEGGKEYVLRVVFKAKEGYEFDDAVVFTVNNAETTTYGDKNLQREIHFVIPAAATYPVTVENGKINIYGGTSSGNYRPDSTVAIIANEPESGKRFKKWISDEVSFANAKDAETTFCMPAKAVTVKATYEDIPAVTYTVSFDANGGTGTMAAATGVFGKYKLPANEFTAPAGQQFKAWSVDGVEMAAHSEINVTANTTVKALWKDGHTSGEGTTGTSGSGGGFSGSYNYPVIVGDTDGADVAVSDEHATKGEKITITVKPEAGKKVDEVIVTDADGDVIPVTKAGDNQYTFTMPAGKVNVEVTTENADYSQRIVMQINNKNILDNGKTMVNDVAPVIVGDRTLVPIRVVTELLGGTADWNDDTRTVTLNIDGKVLSMTIGREIPGFGTSAVIMNDRTYVPVRYVMEMLGANVEWIGATRQIIIEK